MSGHSKWSNTKHRKARQDKKKSIIFTKITREIIIAVKSAGKDPDSNFQLRKIINKALSNNMTRNNINHAINYYDLKKKKKNYAKIFFYGGHGPKGIALLIQCLSNNHQKTVSNIKYIFSQCNYSLGKNTSVEYLFNKRNELIFINNDNIQKEINNFSEYIENIKIINHKFIQLICDMNASNIIQQEFQSKNQKIYSKKIIFTPKLKIDLKDTYNFTKILKNLKNLNDVENIYHNINI
ncbi:YebC/PmpR family DNA-binding transcriptional regulator [Buchnera aphidicola]|uniref:YebC/PmpR family DNA-binding transcriptional regulator n=1 Tax=Buchnera aphidicola TaxID=9 RepID=UPI003464E7A5